MAGGIKGTGRFYYLTPLLDEAEEVVEFCSHCLKWQDAWSGGDYNGFSHQSDWITDQSLSNGNVMGRFQKNTAAFFSLVLKTPIPENADKKEWKSFLGQEGTEPVERTIRRIPCGVHDPVYKRTLPGIISCCRSFRAF